MLNFVVMSNVLEKERASHPCVTVCCPVVRFPVFLFSTILFNASPVPPFDIFQGIDWMDAVEMQIQPKKN
jgi:hypothetical protein